jgi:Ohr subfamily peroxiredoxin
MSPACASAVPHHVLGEKSSPEDPMNIFYRESATTTGGRDGHGESADGKVKVDFSVPKQMGGAGGAGATPEHLFAVGYSACFGSALQFVAGKHHKKLTDITVTADVGIGTKEGGAFGFDITLTVKLPGLPHDEAQALAEEAHTVCPYSNAVRGNVPVTLVVE